MLALRFSYATLLRLAVLAKLCLSLSIPLQAHSQALEPLLDYQVYLPALRTFASAIQLHGYVTDNGLPVAGVRVDLQLCNDTCYEA